jgi:DnaJ-domain-containing proteins 1
MFSTIIIIVIVAIVLFFIFRKPISQSNQTSKETSHNKRGIGGAFKWIGGGLGWAYGGPLGAILGFALGKMFEGLGGKDQGFEYMGATEQQRDFNGSLLVLSAAVMKADGIIRKSELDFVKHFFLTNFGQQRAEKYILTLREILKQDINVREVSLQIGQNMDYSSKLQLLHYLFGIASADGLVSEMEMNVLRQISTYMGISNTDMESIKAMFVQEVDSSYKILEIDENATDDEVKKAYREMAKKYHPDKVSHLGDDVRKAAEEKLQQVNAAYDKIKKKRGIV